MSLWKLKRMKRASEEPAKSVDESEKKSDEEQSAPVTEDKPKKN